MISIFWIPVCQTVLAFVEEAVLQHRGRFGLCLVSFLRWMLLLIMKIKRKFFKAFTQHLTYGGQQWIVVVVMVAPPLLSFYTCKWVRTPVILTAALSCSWICSSNRLLLSTAQPCFTSVFVSMFISFPFSSSLAALVHFNVLQLFWGNFELNKISSLIVKNGGLSKEKLYNSSGKWCRNILYG